MAQVKLFQEDRSVHGTSHIVSRGPQCPWHKSHCFKRTAVSMAQVTLFQENRMKTQLNEPGKQNFCKTEFLTVGGA